MLRTVSGTGTSSFLLLAAKRKGAAAGFDIVFMDRDSLAWVEKELAESGFSRCNSCYLVNMRYVTGL